MLPSHVIAFETPWFKIVEIDPGDEASGVASPYYCVVRQNSVICLVITDSGDIIMVEQFRPPLGRNTLEFPAGAIEAGELPIDAVAREVLEETGYTCQNYVMVTTCRLMPHRENVNDYFFIGFNAKKDHSFKKIEHNTVHIIPRRTLLDMIMENTIEQTVVLGAFYILENKYCIRLLYDDIQYIKDKLSVYE